MDYSQTLVRRSFLVRRGEGSSPSSPIATFLTIYFNALSKKTILDSYKSDNFHHLKNNLTGFNN